MNWLDILLLIIFASSAMSGLRRGFARTLVGIASVILGLLIACWTYGTAGAWLTEYVSHRSVANFIGFLLVFGVVTLAGEIVGRILAGMFKWVGLGWLDRLMGAGVGLIQGLFVAIGIVMLLCAFTRTPPPPSVVNSRIAPYVLDASSLLAAIAPRELKDGFDSSYTKVKELWEKMWNEAPKKLKPEKV